ncbi:MAG: transposase, partial [Acidimicrobiales bacterium]
MVADDVEILRRFRDDLYGCCRAWGDALFELGDAMLGAAGPVCSVPSLSLEPEFTRSHGSAYKALARGRIDEDRLRRLLVDHRRADWPLVFAVDASTWARSDAETSPGRGFYHSASRHSAGQPIVAGWSYQWISQLSWANDSWSAPLDAMRLTPATDATTATVDQVRRLVGLLPVDQEVPLFVFDAGYDAVAIGHDLSAERVDVLARIRDDRVFYSDPPPRANPPAATGRPRRHGTRHKCSDPAGWATPDVSGVTSDARYGTIRVSAWAGLHPRLSGRGHWKDQPTPPIVKGSVIRVEVEHLPKPTGQTKKTLWLWWSGEGEPDLERCVRAYLHRFDIEHG